MQFKSFKFRYLVILLLLVIAFFAWKNYFNRIYVYDRIIKNDEETYALVDQMVTLGKTRVKYSSKVPPFIQFDRVMKKAEGDNIYTYCEFYGFSYTYMASYDGYEVELELKKPVKDYNKKMEKRVAQIADCFRGLGSDYEKIKAVHDYICLNAKYNFTYGGAYSNLFRGESTCTGYAYSFYAIMKKLNIPVTLEYSSNHVWNKVQLDGKWYNMDVTWDDGEGSTVYYDNFLKCDRDWVGHDHGGSDAEESYPVTGEDAKHYYKMVPNYRLYKNILLYGGATALLVLVLLYAFVFSKKQKKDAGKEAMKFGDWVFYHPENEMGVQKVIIQFNKNLQRTESWEIENGRFYHVVKEKKNPVRRMEVSKNDFISQLELVMNAARTNRREVYMKEIIQVRESLR